MNMRGMNMRIKPIGCGYGKDIADTTILTGSIAETGKAIGTGATITPTPS